MSQPSSLTEMSPIPAHVPADLVYDFDYRYDPELIADPHERLLKIVQEAPPIFYTPRHGGHWVLSSHHAVTEGVRTPEIFSSNSPSRDGKPAPALLPLMVDPPIHQSYRTPLNGVFSTRHMMLLQDDIRALARDLITAVADQGECDFIAAIGEPLPVKIFLRLIGLPQENLAEFREIVKATHAGSDPAKSGDMLATIAGIMEPYIVERREKRGTDLISQLWGSIIDGRPITIEEMRNYCILLYTAGLDTVVNAMGFAVRHLARDPALQKRLRDNPSDIPLAVEEMLRRYGIVMTPRLIKEDREFQGVQFRAGDIALMVTPTANLDAAAFPNPEVYDMDRDNKSHLTFNAGPHRCVGSHLARFEMHILYEELLSILPEFRLAPDKHAQFQTGNVLSVLSLPIVWNAQ